ncbi:RNA-binding 25 [Micractinium conductrix]|uniref:RNA-binding 25 n=1 Tax=Micractinium conductrix TaxID=554055 RepID=A0A2P6V4Z1_9CHLO|nr:RNA-binding 25 [Micractinium conductrix]|eukprot:PSC69161.1 RNA-binding 25 [Micractinium conductrix]
MATTAGEQPAGGELFTRGGRDAPDTRGLSMVAKHLEKQQKEKEQRAMERLHLLLPALGPTVRAIALQECNWDEERALTMLRRFQVAKTDELSKLHKERRRHQLALQSGKPERRDKKGKKEKKRRREEGGSSGSDDSGSSSGSDSGSDSDSDSGSGSEYERARGKGGKRRRSRSRSASPKKGRKEKRSSKDKRRGSKEKKKKREKREKKDKKRRGSKEDKAKPKVGPVGLEYGKYGIIRETDMYSKRPEFQLWAIEVKKIDIEAMPRSEEKEMFKEFMEEFNTASFPHKKFYDLDMYEKQQAAKAAKKGGPKTSTERTVFDDETERKREFAAERARQQAERMKQAYEELKTTDKAKDMREQQMMRQKMELAYKTGDRATAEKLQKLLEPTDIAEIGKVKRAPATGT